MTSLLSEDRPLRILLVEDNPGDARLVEAHLRDGLDEDFDLRQAGRLEEGLRKFREQPADLVLLDLNLPDATGLETVRRFQAAIGDEPIVVLTGLDDEETALEALREGAQDYLAKDRLDADILRRSIRYGLERHRTSRQLEEVREARMRLAGIIEVTPDFVGLADARGRIHWVNGPGKKMVGLPEDEDLEGEPIERFHPDWVHATIREEAIPTALEEGLWQGGTALLTSDGEEIPVSQTIVAHRGEGGEVRHLSTVMRDVSEAREREAKLRRSERRLQRVLETLVEGVCITDADGRVLFANRGAEEILERPADELLGRRVADGTLGGGKWRLRGAEGEPREDEELAVTKVLVSGEAVHNVEHVLHRPGRKPKVVSVNAAPLDSEDGEREGVVASLRDVTRQWEAEQELERQALHDRLTGLPNRTLFFDRLERAIARAQRSRGSFAVLFVDLDGFKAVNDTLGHAAGDHVLERVAERIRECLREEDTVARIGGDEFTVLLEDFDDPDDVRIVVERILESLGPPHQVQGESFRVPASIGVAMAGGEVAPERLVRRADQAMYRAKQEGGGGFHLFDPEEEMEDPRRLRHEARIREGLREDEFVLRYHPVVELATGEVRGLEALARWHHPERGLLPPSDFIDLAEETGLMVELGERLIPRAVRDAARWQQVPTPLFLNLSASQVEWDGLEPALREALGEAGLGPDLLRLEVAERFLDRSRDWLAGIGTLGADLYIDDFGVDASSLAQLPDLPVDGLKLDPSLAAGLGRSEEDENLVRAILELGESLGLEVVAEGVEREDQRRRLLELGCRLGQGFLTARPMDADETEAWLEERRG